MLFNAVKKKALRKAVEGTKLPSVPLEFNYQVKTIGILSEKKEQSTVESMINILVDRGFKREDILVLYYDGSNSKVKEEDAYVFKLRDFESSLKTSNESLKVFVEKPFDLLISFYKSDTIPLLWGTSQSKAKFKVGLASVTSFVNHFNIEMNGLDAELYVKLLFEYINIFKN
ncbi:MULTISPECIES: DUF6913 domain-containing protein [Myroides]|uniref:Uncharacterized protein n=1 Tax=Myroides albus TaxID=2562892 RepID=A0A6I3LLJ1_9FLAO|nr:MULTISPECIES: hypothetical protein [Myroides]MTG98376.1 hypothetical protein [Myroides albus]MVX35727.1 hypothetical protein [Myroides sp. LoEW2-1]UVD80369.1 hypothetical protein NWE55_03615 [Myroides albus]